MHPDFPKISRVSWCFISVKVEGKKCIFFCVKKRSFPERPHHTLIGFGAMGVSQSATLSWFLRSKKDGNQRCIFRKYGVEQFFWQWTRARVKKPRERCWSEQICFKISRISDFLIEIVRLILQETDFLRFFCAAYLSSKHSILRMLRETMNAINMGIVGRRCGLGIAGLESDGKPESKLTSFETECHGNLVSKIHDFLRSRISSKTRKKHSCLKSQSFACGFLRGKNLNFQLLALRIFFDLQTLLQFARLARLEWQKKLDAATSRLLMKKTWCHGQIIAAFQGLLHLGAAGN